MPSTIFTVRPIAGFSLADLPNLQPRDNLHIKGLENVTNRRDARNANLISKELSRLHLTWARNANSAEEVLEALRPHVGLQCFGLSGYGGMNIPNWMENISIFERYVNLVDVKLMKCINCSKLPPLGKLPRLTTLYLSQMTNVMYIDDSPYEDANEQAFPSLEEMTLYDLPNLKRVLKTKGANMLSQLNKLSIQSIPLFELPSLPSVKEVYVGGETEELNDHGASFLRDIAGKMSNLTELMIEEFDQIKELPIEISSLGSLQKLYISGCRNLESIRNMSSSSLQVLSFVRCHSLKSLTQSTTTLTSLRRLQIHYCPKLILPANMSMLTSLREVTIMGGDKRRRLYNGLEDIPLLQNLSLEDFPSPRSLPDWLGDTLSLQELKISKFPKLTSLPDNFDQLENLQKLDIDRCPRLVNRLARRTGEDWYKIAHVPILRLRLESDVVHPIDLLCAEEYSDSDMEVD